MKYFWQNLLRGIAREVLPELWDAIESGKADRAAILARLAAQRYAEHKSAEELLDKMAAKRHGG